jgi:hypothetical protein
MFTTLFYHLLYLKENDMVVIPLEIKISCTFGTLDSENTFVLEKNAVTVDIQQLNQELFAKACEQLMQVRNDLAAKNPA